MCMSTQFQGCAHAAIHDLVKDRDELRGKVADLQATVDLADG